MGVVGPGGEDGAGADADGEGGYGGDGGVEGRAVGGALGVGEA